MGIASRLIRLCKADLHGVMDQIEDRELLLKQYLREMETALAVKKTRIERLNARRTRAAREVAIYGNRVDAIEEDLALAVAREKDDIARMLIRKKHPLSQSVDELEERLARWGAEIEDLEETHARQVAAYEQMRLRAAAVEGGRGAGMPPPSDGMGPGCGRPGPGDEEIELELIQRKEALKTGRLS